MIACEEAKAARLAEQGIAEELKKQLEPAIAELNESLAIEETITELEPALGYEDTVSKTDTYLQIRVAPQGSTQPVPPETKLVGDAPVEIWAYPRSKELDLITVLVEWEKARVFLGAMNLEIPAIPDEDELKVSPQGDWELLQVYPTLPETPTPGI